MALSIFLFIASSQLTFIFCTPFRFQVNWTLIKNSPTVSSTLKMQNATGVAVKLFKKINGMLRSAYACVVITARSWCHVLVVNTFMLRIHSVLAQPNFYYKYYFWWNNVKPYWCFIKCYYHAVPVCVVITTLILCVILRFILCKRRWTWYCYSQLFFFISFKWFLFKLLIHFILSFY